MENILGGFFCGKCPPDYPNGYKKRQTVKESTKKTNWNLQFHIMRSLICLHVIGKCSVDCPPITRDIDQNEKDKKEREEKPN